MKIAARQDIAPIDEQQGVVRDGVRLEPQRDAAISNEIEAGTHHLRLAAKRIRILDPAAIEVRCANGAAGDQFAVFAGDGNLSGLAPYLVNAVVEGRIAALQRVHRHGARDDRGAEHVLGAEQSRQCQRGGYLCAVDERESFLGVQSDSLQSRQAQPFGRRQHLASHADAAHAQQRGAQVRQRGEIAGGAHRSLRRDHRIDLVLEQCHEAFHQSQRDAGMTSRQRVDLERENQPDDGVGQGVADAGRVRKQEISLQQFELVRGYARLCEQPEARVDAIGGVAGRYDPVDQRGGCRDPLAVVRREAEHGRLLIDPPQAGQAHLARMHLGDVDHATDARSSAG